MILIVMVLILAVIGILFLRVIYKILRYLAINTIVGLILVGILNFFGIVHIDLNLINLLIIAVGGVVGVFILILLSIL